MEKRQGVGQQTDAYWRSRIFAMCVLLASITSVIEGLYFVAGICGVMDIGDTTKFLIRYVLVPTAVNFGGILIARKALSTKRFGAKRKNQIVCYLGFLLTAVVQCTYYSYVETSTLPCIVIIFAGLFVDLKLCRNLCALSYVTLAVAAVERYAEGLSSPIRILVGYVIAAMIFYVAYRVAVMLAQHEYAQFWLMSRSRKKKIELIEQIRIEPMTGLLSRRILMEKLERCCKNPKNHSESMHLAMVDIDNFKKINDTYGHPCGDEVLYKIGRIIKENIKGIAEGFRYGGEEFVVVFEESNMDDVVRVMEKIRMAMAKTKFDFLDQGKITISCGIAEYKWGMKSTEWLRRADNSLYQAKHEGKNRVIVNLEQAG